MRTLGLCTSLLLGTTVVVKSKTIVLKNAKIYTVNPDQPWAQAVAIDDENGMILQVGDEVINDDEDAVVIDMGGRLVLPGFQDAHLHAVEAGINKAACEFDPQPPLADLPFYFDDCEEAFGDQGWLLGSGVDLSYVLDQVDLGETEYPITILDAVYPNTPVVILDTLGHGAIANSVAMKAVGYDLLTNDPPGGVVLRDEFTNELVGIVLENAQQKLRDAAFPPTIANEQTAYESLLDALSTLAANGITSVSDAGGFWHQAQTNAWARDERQGRLTVRATNALYIYPDQPMEEQLPLLLERYSNDDSSLVKFNQAKIYVDGILSLGTGAMKEPYAVQLISEVSNLGFEYFGDSLMSVSQTLVERGFRLHFHVTGDRGASLALDAIGAVGGGGPHRLTHCFLVNEQDRNRFVALNAFADFQVAPSSINQENLNLNTQLLGADRASQLIPALNVYNIGPQSVVLSSDWDADELSPLVKLKTVLTTRPNGSPAFPNVEAVIPLMTRNPAKLLETNTGSIEPGKLADLVALDTDIFNIPVDTIDQAKVVFTMFNGRVVYDPTGIGTGIPSPPTPAPASSSSSSISTYYFSFFVSSLVTAVMTFMTD